MIFTTLTVTLPAAAAVDSSSLALTAVSDRQYHIAATPVSPAIFRPVSDGNPALDLPSDPAPGPGLKIAQDRGLDEEDGQYQRRLALRIAGFLGIVYVVFLVGWFWATRARPRRRD
jgi:hypothetical protein